MQVIAIYHGSHTGYVISISLKQLQADDLRILFESDFICIVSKEMCTSLASPLRFHGNLFYVVK